MAINDYSSLKTAIASWLARSDLTDRIPDFIALAEAKFNRHLDVRQMEQRSTATIDTASTDPQFISLPLDFQSMRRVCLSSVTGKPTLEYLTPTALYAMKFSSDAGQPAHFTIIGSNMELMPVPDQNYTIEMVYRKNIPALSDANTSNWLLALAPDAYLYGSLMEASIFTKEDERVPLWAQAYAGVLDGLKTLNFTSAYNAGPISVMAIGVTP